MTNGFGLLPRAEGPARVPRYLSRCPSFCCFFFDIRHEFAYIIPDKEICFHIMKLPEAVNPHAP
jgi:hypothetical protein